MDYDFSEYKADEYEIYQSQRESNKYIEEIDISSEKAYLLQNIYIKYIINENDNTGIGYQLNNNDIGIHFNDDSIMTKFSEINNLIYYRNPPNRLHKINFPLNFKIDKDFLNYCRRSKEKKIKNAIYE